MFKLAKSSAQSLAAAMAWLAPTALAHAPSGHAESEMLAWSNDSLVIGLLAISCALYLMGWRCLHAKSRNGARKLRLRGFCFLLGLAFTVAALLSPIDTLGDELFSMHMLQHELLMLAAAPLLVMGRPLGIFIWAFAPPVRQCIASAVRNDGMRRVWKLLNMPLTAWILHAVILWAWHMPSLFQASLSSNAMHTLQHFSFLASALLFWSALTVSRASLHAGNAVLYLLTTAIHTGILGALLTFSSALWYSAYAATTAQWGFTALEDQQLGGLIMWVPAGFVFVAAGLAMACRLLAPDWQPGTAAGVKR